MSLKLAFSLLVAGLFLLIISGLILPVALGMVLAVILHPLHVRMMKRGFKPRIAASLVTLATAVLVLLPVTGLTITATRVAISELQHWRGAHAQGSGGDSSNKETLRTHAAAPRSGAAHAATPSPAPSAPSATEDLENSFMALAEKLRKALPELPWDSNQIAQTVEETTRGALGRIGEWLGQAVQQLPGLGIALVLMVVGLYFGLTEGVALVGWMGSLSPYSKPQTQKLITVLRESCRSVVLASVVSGASQSLLALIFFAVVRVPNAVLLSLLVFLGSFVPLIGAVPVTFGVTLYLAWHGSWGLTVLMGIGAIAVGTVDNFVRPWMLQGRTNLHPLVAFLSALGGLQWLGFFGVFFGPILASLFVAIVEMHSHRTADVG